MIVDTSALVAVLRAEEDAPIYAEALANQPASLSAVSYVECGAVMDSDRDPVVSRALDELLRVAEIEIAPFTAAQAELARQAYRDFGKGSGHRARLNFGECMSYALAVDRGEPLLWKGNDFSHTGIDSALDA